ncbi:chromate transporter [Mycoplasma sp. Mirounga ES2805-ORL]|uniref:chromate transporter n=1 Tax=Mycoplasma sp. Mirounga ES2805-ORL TaxID=754514 RepID=UPI00197B35DD|nr:chromate transporter [Mycoplasma sp. Mirounga ES2805-ORL]QSF13981.1 chromate transporter [Mycoplasma sp. Mirounga ES2805-ORL]
MSILLIVVISLLFVIFISLIVFGGGQVFMPIFIWFWNTINHMTSSELITQNDISTTFTVSNATPGILSPKLAFISGYLILKDNWLSIPFMLLLFLTLSLPAIFMMIYAKKKIGKIGANKSAKLLKILNPIIAGIIGALAIQLLIPLINPSISFNQVFGKYIEIIKSEKTEFFQGIRKIVLFCYVPIGIIFSLILYIKKIPIFWLIIGNMILSILIFFPWT